MDPGYYNITIILYNNESLVNFCNDIYISKPKKEILPIISYFIETLSGFEKYNKDFKKVTEIKINNSSTYYKIKSWNYTLEVYTEPTRKDIILLTPIGKYSRTEGKNKTIERIECAYGKLEDIIENGNLREVYYGDLNNLKLTLNNLRDYAVELLLINDIG